MNQWLLILLIFLAVYRGTRLLVADALPFVSVPRRWLVRILDPRDEQRQRTEPAPLGGFGRSIAYLITCEWCTSAYVGALIVWATTRWISVPVPLLVWAASSAFTGLTAAWEGWNEQKFKLAEARMWLAHDDMKTRGYTIPTEDHS